MEVTNFDHTGTQFHAKSPTRTSRTGLSPVQLPIVTYHDHENTRTRSKEIERDPLGVGTVRGNIENETSRRTQISNFKRLSLMGCRGHGHGARSAGMGPSGHGPPRSGYERDDGNACRERGAQTAECWEGGLSAQELLLRDCHSQVSRGIGGCALSLRPSR